MRTEQKIWSFFALIFFLLAMAAIRIHALWFVSTVAVPVLLTGLISVLRNVNPFPAVMIVPHHTSTFNAIGPIASPIILELLKEENLNIPRVSVFISVSATAVGFFCSLMIVRTRAVSTDLGILHGLCYISVHLGLQEFDYGWPTLVAFGLSTVMVFLRVCLETPPPPRRVAGRV
ncbi:hypothetical protein AABB24_016501 [Solanum stoloniferum]